LRSLATLQYRSGQLPVAESTGRSLLKLARKAGDRTAWKAGLNIVGLSQWQRGLFDEARPFFEQARRLAVADGDEVGLSIFTSNTAMVDKASGRYDQALAGYRSSLDISRRRGKIDSVVSALNNMANIFRVQEKYDDAMACLNEAMAVCKQEGLASARPFVDVNLGLTHLQAGRVEEAKPHLARSLEDAHSHGEPMIEAAALLGQAEIELHQHNLSAARSRIDLALAIAERLPSAPLQAQCAFALGQVEFLGGHTESGAALMQWGLGRPALNRADFDVLSRNMARLGLSATQSDAVVADMTLIQLLAQRSA
jgi:tetratricopeptide (TPR) repeat protein